MVNPFLVPPRLALRALDDLHSLALAAERLPAFEEKLDARFDAVEGHLEGLPPSLKKLERNLVRGFESLEKQLTDHLGSLDEQLETGLSALREQLGTLPPDLEERLRPHLVKQISTIESLKPELENNRLAAEGVPPRLDGLLREMGILRQEIQEVREVLEPLQGTTERIGRITHRLPG